MANLWRQLGLTLALCLNAPGCSTTTIANVTGNGGNDAAVDGAGAKLSSGGTSGVSGGGTGGTPSSGGASGVSGGGAGGTPASGGTSGVSGGGTGGSGGSIGIDGSAGMGAAGGSTGAGGGCTAPGDAGAVKRVFTTSTLYKGDFGVGGTSAFQNAAALCQTRATQACLGGTWKAWVYDGTTDPSLPVNFTHFAGPYMTVAGKTIASSWQDLTDGTLTNPINTDEYGDPVTGAAYAWTALNADATGIAVHCQNWTSKDATFAAKVGSVHSITGSWTNSIFTGCDQPLHLYCFEQ